MWNIYNYTCLTDTGLYSEYGISYSLNFLGIEIRHGIQIKSNKHKIEIENIENIEIEKKI